MVRVELGLAELFFRLGELSRGGPAILPGVTRRVKEDTRRVDRESQRVGGRLDSPSRHGTRRVRSS